MVILNIVLMALIGAAIVSLLLWSVFTQHRDPHSAHVRVRRLRISIRLVPLDSPARVPARVEPPLA